MNSIKQNEQGRFYMVAPDGSMVFVPPPVEIRIGNKFKSLNDPDGLKYEGGFASNDARGRTHLVVNGRRVDASDL